MGRKPTLLGGGKHTPVMGFTRQAAERELDSYSVSVSQGGITFTLTNTYLEPPPPGRPVLSEPPVNDPPDEDDIPDWNPPLGELPDDPVDPEPSDSPGPEPSDNPEPETSNSPDPAPRPDGMIPDYVLAPEIEMPTAEVDECGYIGYISIPSLGIELPVMSEWSYPMRGDFDLDAGWIAPTGIFCEK